MISTNFSDLIELPKKVMDKMKRTANFNHSWEFPSKKSNKNFDDQKPIMRIEDLSNEIFYELFDYLGVLDLYEIFVDLNSRFRRLVTESSHPLKIKLISDRGTMVKDLCQNIIIPNTHRIRSLHLLNSTLIEKFFGQCLINKSFINLQSIVPNGISEYQLLKLLFYFYSLPNLFSLTIHFEGDFGEHLDDIYHMIFHLPNLKYLQLSSSLDSEIAFSVPSAINEQLSIIKHLFIKHSCTINTLMSILYHTPQLSYLTCADLNESDNDNNNDFTIQLLNLTHISIHHSSININNFERFLKNIDSHLEVLRIKLNNDINYLDVNRWKHFIEDNMPNLYKFIIRYCEYTRDDNEDDGASLAIAISQMMQPFWNEGEWNFKLELDDESIEFLIHQSKLKENRLCNDRQDDTLLIPTSSTVSIRIKDKDSYQWKQSFFQKIKRSFSIILYCDLHVHPENLSMYVLLNILHLLPNIDSLTLSSFPSIQSENLSSGDADIRSLVANNNKITKIAIEQILSFEQIQYLIDLCPYLRHFHISCPYDNNMMQFIRFILTKGKINNPNFYFLRLYIPGINKKMIHPIQFMIDSENLLTNYTIKHIPDHIIFEWKQ